MSDIAIRASVENGIGGIVLDHPPVNVLTRGVLSELRETLRRLAEERELRVLTLSARGKHFSAGADVAEHMPPVYREMIPEFLETVSAVAEFPVPVIAAVRGRCLGGGFELVAAADIVIAAQGATFGQPEIKLAVLPPAACVMLPALAPWGVAAELMYTGEPITAAQARDAGLVRHVVPEGELDVTVGRVAAGIARHSAAALRVTKRCMRRGWAAQAEALKAAGQLYMDELMATEDAVAGLAAFLEKRQPVWGHV